jgi:ABC-type sulfate/molybdate transport systems ATPase subunit
MAKVESAPRKAILKKKKGYLNKFDEVLIKEKYMGHSRYEYTAFRYGTPVEMGVKVTRSEFDYTENETFIVHVTRVSYSSKNIKVQAKDRKEAERLANEAAGNEEFSEQDAEYKVDLALTETEHNNLFKQ